MLGLARNPDILMPLLPPLLRQGRTPPQVWAPGRRKSPQQPEQVMAPGPPQRLPGCSAMEVSEEVQGLLLCSTLPWQLPDAPGSGSIGPGCRCREGLGSQIRGRASGQLWSPPGSEPQFPHLQARELLGADHMTGAP